MGTCKYCKNNAKTISNTIGFCADCIRAHFESIWPEIKKVHHQSRIGFGLPEDPPLLIASTLLVPGYVDESEVPAIARFIAGLNPRIPYSLLAFYPQFYLDDLPTTSRSHAHRCLSIAEKAGLKNVHVGNVHLLADDY